MISFHNSLIEIPEWGSISLIEILWLASGMFALGVSSMRIMPLWSDYQLTKQLDHKDLCIIARGYLRREILRIVTALIITFIGVYTVVTYPAMPGPARVSVAGILITAGLFLISLIVSIQSILDWRDRAKTIEIVTLRRDE